jgi:uncharacterized protein
VAGGVIPPSPWRGGWSRPQISTLSDDRLHLQHGPIDLVVKADGEVRDLRAAYAAAADRFQAALGELVAELPMLRRPLAGRVPPDAASPIAQRMIAACWPHRSVYITPMAAVAGSVADEIKHAMLAAAPGLRTLYVNNGGDIAAHAAAGRRLTIGIVPDLAAAAPDGVITLDHASCVGGVATSGWRGRSFSLGVADAVTILARSAAAADAAATIVANAVTVDHPAVRRTPARSLDPDSDLGEIPVTTDVGALPPDAVAAALASGLEAALRLRRRGLILGALLALQGDMRIMD